MAMIPPIKTPTDPVREIFTALERTGITYCVLRDGDCAEELMRGGEIDLLVRGSEFERFRAQAADLGLVSFPLSGRSPHRFFVTYLEDGSSWLKLDVVTRIVFGHPLPTMATRLGDECLVSRQKQGNVFVPAPEMEFVSLLLHCVLDKKRFDPRHRDRLRVLAGTLGASPRLRELLAAYGPRSEDPSRLLDAVVAGDWEAILSQREEFAARLGSCFSNSIARLRARLLRRVDVLRGLFRRRAPCVAILAPDGAGKSTLVEGLKDHFPLAVESIYMGLYSKNRRRIGSLPGLGLLLNLWFFHSRWLKAHLSMMKGRLVLFDRYCYDLLLPPARKGGFLSAWRRRILGSCCPRPDVLVILDAPGEVLFARKKEHSPELLERQRQGYLSIADRVPGAVVVDATHSAQAVRCQVERTIWLALRSMPR